MPIKAEGNEFCYVVAYIDSNFIHVCQHQLDRYPEYKQVEPYIPTIKVLKKKFKNKEQFEDVPLLFQYGFFKIPRKFAIHYSFLEGLQKNISCILAWVKDPLKVAKENPRLKDTNIPVATATSEEIAELIKATINLGAHSADDIDMLNPGDLITLKGYPWEGMEAEFLKLDDKKNQAVVRIVMFNHVREIKVPLESIFFNLYRNKGYDDSVTVKQSLDEMEKRGKLQKFSKK